MTNDFQPGQHPDADTLSAFAEDALPAHEREQMLAHLAACGHCREVVSLALPPMEDEPQQGFIPVQKPWFASWKLALPAVGFVAAALVVFFAVHHQKLVKPDPVTTLTAKNDGPKPENVPPPQLESAPAAVNVPPPFIAKTPALAMAKPSLPAPAAAQRDSLAVTGTGSSANGTFDRLEMQDLPVNGRSTTALKQSFGGAAGGSVLSQPAVAPPANPVAAAMAPPPLAAQPPPPAVSNSDTAEVAADAATIATSANSVASPMRGLPSRRAILSSITHERQTLALDNAGALFVSVDNGQHWKAVPSQWQGRAVKLTLAAYPPPLVAERAAAGIYADKARDAPGAGAAAISGTISDPSGAVVGRANIVLKDSSARVVRSIKADASGNYALDGLPAGTYQVEASSQGFVESRSVTTLAAGQHLPLDVILKVGEASETVSVTAEPPLLESQSAVRTRSLKTPAKARIVPPVMLFELTTESGERWSSADGQSWRRN